MADRFTVSKMTIHRDLDDLEQAGVVRKIRGGATIDAGVRFESDFRIRERQGNEAKISMARCALELVEPGMTVMVNDGSMAAVLGEMLLQKRPLTLITNNAAIIETAEERKRHHIDCARRHLLPEVQRVSGRGHGGSVVASESGYRFHLDARRLRHPCLSHGRQCRARQSGR